MTLKATDMELAFEAVVPVEGQGNRAVAIPGKKFVETVRVYPDGLLTLEWPDTGNRIWLRAKGFNSEHNIQPGEGFPELPKPERGPAHRHGAAQRSSARPSAGFHLREQGRHQARPLRRAAAPGQEFIRVVSTDGFRLAVVEMPL